jgi:hypothetical protein
MPDKCVDPTSELRESEARLREALESELLGSAAEKLIEYRRRFEEVWNRLSLEEQRRSELPAQALRLMEWAHSVAVSIRASAVEQRRRTAACASPYRSAARRRTWQVTV